MDKSILGLKQKKSYKNDKRGYRVAPQLLLSYILQQLEIKEFVNPLDLACVRATSEFL